MTLTDDINEQLAAVQSVPVRDVSPITFTPKAPAEVYSPLMERAANCPDHEQYACKKRVSYGKCKRRIVIPWLPSCFHWGQALKLVDDIDVFTALDAQQHYTSKDHKKDPIPFAELPYLILSEMTKEKTVKSISKCVEYNRRCEKSAKVPLDAKGINDLINEVRTMYILHEAAQIQARQKLAQKNAAAYYTYPDALYEFKKDPENEGEKIAIDIKHPEVCSYIKQKLIPVSFNDTLFIYEDGIYRENAHDVDAIVVDILHDRNIKRGEGRTCSDIIHALKGMEPKFTEYPFNPVGTCLVVENGVINIEGGSISLDKHHPRFMATYKLPVEYDEKASPQAFRQFISQIVSDDDAALLVQIPAQGIYQYMRRATFKRNYLLYGETNCGKSTYLDLLTLFFGKPNLSEVSLQELCGDNHFITSTMEGKILNLVDELRDIPLSYVGEFKKMTGGVNHWVEKKGKDRYDGIITAPHVYSANVPPPVSDNIIFDNAWWDRWELIPFPNEFPKNPRFQQDTFTTAFMSGMLNAVLEEITKIYRKNTLTVNRDADEVRERWCMTSDPLKMWLSECFTETSQSYNYDKEPLFERLKAWYDYTNISPLKRIKSVEGLGRRLPVEGFLSTMVDITPEGGKKREHQKRAFVAELLYIGFKDEKDITRKGWSATQTLDEVIVHRLKAAQKTTTEYVQPASSSPQKQFTPDAPT